MRARNAAHLGLGASLKPRLSGYTTLAPHAWARDPELRVAIEDVPSGKPSLASYLLEARRLGVAPAGCLVLEDSRVGARAAVAAGATCVWVTCGAIDPTEARRVTPWVAKVRVALRP